MPKKTKEKTSRAKKIKNSPQKIKEKEKPIINNFIFFYNLCFDLKYFE